MWLAWLGIWTGISKTCGSVWSNGKGKNTETDEEYDKFCVKEVFQLARVKLDRDSEGGSEAPDVGNCGINIWDGSERELDWFKKSTSIFL